MDVETHIDGSLGDNWAGILVEVALSPRSTCRSTRERNFTGFDRLQVTSIHRTSLCKGPCSESQRTRHAHPWMRVREAPGSLPSLMGVVLRKSDRRQTNKHASI